MSSRDGRRSFHAEMPEEVLDAVKEEASKSGKPMWEVFNESVRMFLGLDEVSTEASVQRHIERLEAQVDELHEQKQDIEDELESKKQKLDGYQRKLQKIHDEKESYETRLDQILDDLEENPSKRVIAFRSRIKELAKDRFGKPNTENREEVKEHLWSRAMEQQREIARYQFQDATAVNSADATAAADGSGGGSSVTDSLSSVQKLRSKTSENSDTNETNDESTENDDDDNDNDGEPVMMTDGGVDTRDVSAELVDHVLEFLQSYYRDEIGHLATIYPDERSLTVDWNDVFTYDHDLADDLLNNEPAIRKHFNAALRDFDLPAPVDLSNATIRFTNLGEVNQQHCDELRAEQIGKFRELKGQIKQRTGAKPIPTRAVFECQRCGTHNDIPADEGNYEEPNECVGCEREGPFKLDFDKSEFKDLERLRLVEPPERTQGANGQHVDVTVDRDLVDSCNPGDRVRIAGNISAEPPNDTDKGMFEYEIEGRNIEHTQESYDEIELDPETVDRIKNVVNDPDTDPFATLINSIRPGHYGDEEIKLSIALQLFSGVRGELPDGSTQRGDIHVLIMGDPGIGKSTLLAAAEEIAPRSASASGKGASKAGLTAAALPSDFSDNGMTLEAGALVLADKGLAAIDEIDKIPDEVSSAMHGAMSKQRVEISKGGFSNVSLPSRTAVLAAGNPKFGRFDQYEPMSDQLELPGALMDRFDLIWTKEDVPEREIDTKITEHILDTTDTATRNVGGKEIDEESVEAISADVDHELLRHWIAYARKNYHPTLTQEVKDRIRDFYIELRSQGYDSEDSPIPVTKRKLQALVRLSQASARVRLSDEVSVDDAQRACQLMLQSMQKVGIDPETGKFDADVIETGMSKSQRDRVKNIKQLINEVEAEHDDGAPVEDVLDRAEDIGIEPEKAENEIEKLRQNGDVYEPRTDRLRTS